MYLGMYFEPSLTEEHLERLKTTLDTCGPWARKQAVHGLTGAQMAALYDAVEGKEPLGLEHFAPSGEALVETIHHGKNSLPLFHRFQKRFCKPDADGDETTLWGYNHNAAIVMAVINPGYFTATANDKGEVVIDYARTPPRTCPTWPALAPPGARLGSLVWGGLTDVLRKVSEHVTVGKAFRHGKPEGGYFALCREDPT